MAICRTCHKEFVESVKELYTHSHGTCSIIFTDSYGNSHYLEALTCVFKKYMDRIEGGIPWIRRLNSLVLIQREGR
jgi:hypothetical protein